MLQEQPSMISDSRVLTPHERSRCPAPLLYSIFEAPDAEEERREIDDSRHEQIQDFKTLVL